ncbi:hypothetical protein PZ895_03820 [Mesorhizobium sp. YIM 152430]|uniref:hypothetical protein n=1 Tax=Mesorhizobium sp. YIM 152430 TaxID=3031761 RepID=UPI0023DA41E5|nr:hypothetical protein [Mesorhizobium sp. YIM 152430]MDF1598906.1 hypothetical protein [Mesorhizobium sp. YIM 152430]
MKELDAGSSSTTDGSISLLELADIIYAKRIFIVLGLIAGCIAFAVVYYSRSDVPPTTRIEISIYGPGAPSTIGTSIAEQASFALAGAGIENVKHNGLLVTIEPSRQSDAAIIDNIMKNVVSSIDEQELQTFRYLEGISKDDDAIPHLASLHSYLKGRELGLRELYSIRSTSIARQGHSLMLPAISMLVFIGLGVILAFVSSFIDAWRNHSRIR